MKSKSLHIIVAVVGLAALSGMAWWMQNRPQTAQEAVGTLASTPGTPAPVNAQGAGAARPAAVEVAKAQTATLRDDAQAVGTLRSRQGVMLRPEVAGRVQALGFADGQFVRRGQLLVQLDDTLQRAEVKQAQAQVSIARANHKRNQELVAQNFVAQRVLDESTASLQVAEAQLALAQARQERMRITAPFDGTLGLRSVNVGDYVKDGADLVNLEDTSLLYVDFRLPERFQTRLKSGQRVELQIDALPGRLFRATVVALDPLIDANGRSVAVRAQLPNTAGEPLPAARPAPATALPVASARAVKVADAQVSGKAGDSSTKAGAGKNAGGPGPLRPGMFARVTAVFAVKDQAVLVPEEAIVPQGGRQFVIKLVAASASTSASASANPSGTVSTPWVSQRVEVKLGVRQSGRVEVLDGVQVGDTVVVAGQQRLQRDGTPARVVDLARAAGPAVAASGRAGASGDAASLVPGDAASRAPSSAAGSASAAQR